MSASKPEILMIMKLSRLILLIIAVTFAVGYCHFGSEVILQGNNQDLNWDILKREYFESLFVGVFSAISVLVFLVFFRKHNSIAPKND